MNRLLPLLLLCAAFVVSCDQRQTSPPAESASDTNHQVFQVRGVIVELLPERKEVRIKHEEIPDYMPAMTMPFDVKDTNELSGLSPGDSVTFRLTVTDTEGWIDQIRKTADAPSSPNPIPAPPGSATNQGSLDIEPLEPGDPLPEYVFTNQFGQTITTTQYKGQALAITFIFTRCPYPTFCPRVSGHFATVHDLLKSKPNAPTNWHLLTLSFDPEFDTPAVLKSYAERYHYDPEHWTFATGSLSQIIDIGQHFGLIFWRDEKGVISHNLRTVLIDPNGHVQQILDGSDWSAEELADAMSKSASTS